MHSLGAGQLYADMEDTQGPTISSSELQKHSTPDDCWIIVHSRIYDVSAFLDEHPGGSASAYSSPILGIFTSNASRQSSSNTPATTPQRPTMKSTRRQ